MDAKKCDRCGQFYIKNEKGGLSIHKIYPFMNDKKVDLCDDCLTELMNWLEKYTEKEE